MAKNSKTKKVAYHTSLTIPDVVDLGKMLIDVADLYPTRFLTERDFYPLVVAYFRGRVPKLHTEAPSEHGGAIDFRLGGTNPALLELAVAPRALADGRHPSQTFPGHGKATTLYASQNRSELRKLLQVPQAKAKNRYVLLLDLMDFHSKDKLKSKYETEAKKLSGSNPVRVVYVSRERDFHFPVR